MTSNNLPKDNLIILSYPSAVKSFFVHSNIEPVESNEAKLFWEVVLDISLNLRFGNIDHSHKYYHDHMSRSSLYNTIDNDKLYDLAVSCANPLMDLIVSINAESNPIYLFSVTTSKIIYNSSDISL